MDNHIRKVYVPMTETSFYILLCLRKEAHGYSIVKQTEQLTNGEVRLSPGTLYGSLSKMEKDGLIKRFRREENQRSVAVTLTERGRKYSETVEKIFLQVEKKFESVLSASELETLKTLLQKILEATENKKNKGNPKK